MSKEILRTGGVGGIEVGEGGGDRRERGGKDGRDLRKTM